MKLSEVPFFVQIKNFYCSLRRNGKTREETIDELMLVFSNEIADLDDAPIFWTAVASAQCSMREVTPFIATKADIEVNRLKQQGTPIRLNDLDRLIKRLGQAEYYQPPKCARMPQVNKVVNWHIGDTFAYPLRSADAQEAHISDSFILIRVADFTERRNKLYPIVYRMLWIGSDLPKSTEEVNTAGYQSGHHRASWPSSKTVYRRILESRTQKELKEFASQLHYVGSFPDAKNPTNEHIIDDIMLPVDNPSTLESKFCYDFLNFDIYYAE